MLPSLAITRTVVGVIGNVISVFLFVSPTPTFVKIYKKKSVEQYKPDPYLATTMNCLLWILYGLPFVHPKSILVVTTNSIGLAIEMIYLLIFFIYADRKGRLNILLWVAIEATMMAIVVTITLMCFHTTHTRSFFVGILSVIFCLGMYAAPLTIMGKVIKTRSVKYMPFWLSVGNFANGVIWTVYALLPLDQWILIPNGLGAISGATQLILYGCYYRANPSEEEEEDAKPNLVQMSSNGLEKSLA